MICFVGNIDTNVRPWFDKNIRHEMHAINAVVVHYCGVKLFSTIIRK